MSTIHTLGVFVLVMTIIVAEGCQFTSKSSLNCTNLREIPSNLSTDITVLIMNDNVILQINKYSFNSTKNLRLLSLQRNKIRLIEQESFSELKRLHSLYLSGNELVKLSSEMFVGLDNLEILILSSNKIEDIDKDTFVGLKNLKKLYLSGNNIRSIDSKLFQYNLKLLYLEMNENNKMVISEEPILYSSSLKNISMKNCNIIYMTSRLFIGITNLEYLNLENNSMMSIDHKAFLPLLSLKWVSLENNNLDCDCEFKLLRNLLSRREATLKWVCEGWEVSHEQDELTLSDLACHDACSVCNCSGDIIYCAKSNLRDMYLPVFSKQHSMLDATYNNISVLKRSIFRDSGLDDLERLDLMNNNISMIEDDTFISLNKLIALNLSNNAIRNINLKTFHGLTDLKKLTLTSNNIKLLSDGVLGNMKNLEFLDVSKNQINNIRDAFTSSENLKLLFLNSNKLNSLTSGMFKGLKGLLMLDLSSNNISLIQKSTFKNLNLTKLDLSHNKIASLSENPFSDLSSLDELILHNNSMFFLFPSYFIGLRTLKSLNLKGNLIDSIEDSVFETMYSLISLNIASNRIEYMSKETFRNLSQLRILNLEDNIIQYLEEGIFNPLMRLETLLLNQNHIQEIHSNMFYKGLVISTLDMSQNNLTMINLYELQKLTNLKSLSVLANPLLCDCPMKQVYDWCLSKKIITRVICHKPNEFLNKKWDVLRQLKCDVTTRRTSTPNWIRSTSKPTTELPKMITSSKPTQITTPATNTLNDVTITVFTEEPKPYSSTQGWDREKPDIDTNSANDTYSIETTKMLEVSTILSFSAEDYYNASFSQHQDADARVSSIILYLLVTLCVLFCIMAGLLAKFVFKNRRLKTPSSNDFSTVDDHNGESEIHSVKLANEATGIENHNFDATKPATTGPICLPMKLLDKSPLKGNNCIKHNSSDLHPYQTEQVAIVHQSDDGVN